MSNSFTILTVCTGNICRSPLAKQLLGLELPGADIIRVDSAGVQAMVDSPMPEQSLEIARKQGVKTPEEHRAKQITEELINQSDLILAMDRGHRKSIVQLSPRATRKVFTVVDLARLIEATTDADLQEELNLAGDSVIKRLHATVEAARLSRSELNPLDNPSDEDIVDPYGKSQSIYEASAGQLIPTIRLIASYLNKAWESA